MLLSVSQVARERRTYLARGQRGPRQAACALCPSYFGKLVDLPAAEGGRARSADTTHHSAALDRAAEHAESTARDHLRDVHDLELVAQVGLVGPVTVHRVLPSDAWPRPVQHTFWAD